MSGHVSSHETLINKHAFLKKINQDKLSARGCSLLWRHNGRDGTPNHEPHDCLLDRSFKHRSKKISKLRMAGLYARNSPVTGEFPAQMASNTENVSIWWRHHA